MHHYCRHLMSLVISLFVMHLATNTCSALDSLPADHPTYQAIQQVYERVAHAFGDGRVPPKLLVNPDKPDARLRVAMYFPGSEEQFGTDEQLSESFITIDERLYNLLKPLGKNRDSGLAVILAHELAHFYYRHGWVNEFGNAFADTNLGQRMLRTAAYDEIIRIETEADYFGGFYGYLAGYNTLGLTAQVLDIIYTAYNIPDDLKSYPSRTERKAIALKSEEHIRKMLPVFEAANRLLLVSKYEEAGRLYQYISRSFPSREMFNNSGVAFAQQALEQADADALHFVYPFELDTRTRLQTTLRGEYMEKSMRSFEQPFRAPRGPSVPLLRKAEKEFREAINRDEQYPMAYINLASVLALLKEYTAAMTYVEKGHALARKQRDDYAEDWALTVRGIIFAETGERTKATADLRKAAVHLKTARTNLSRIRGPKGSLQDLLDTPPQATPKRPMPMPEEQISGISARNRNLVIDHPDSLINIRGVNVPTIEIRSKQTSSYQAQYIRIGSSEGHFFVTTAKDYPGKSGGGITINSPLSHLENSYGTAQRTVGSRNGEFLIYQRPAIIFETKILTVSGSKAPSSLISAWTLYSLWED